jgi:chromosome segregation ATPase
MGPIIGPSMNEEPTKDLPNRSSFEERVFARFDAVDARLEKLESRAYDTKPIWERALKAIMDTGLEVGEIKKGVGVIEGTVGVIESKVAVIETDVAAMKTDYAGIRNELTEMKRELKHQVNKRLDLVLEFLLEGRDDLRDAEERIKQLETKLA